MRRIATHWQVDLDNDAIRAITGRANDPSGWIELTDSAALYTLLPKIWRKLLVAGLAAYRVQAAHDLFLFLTLFDHYCARLHVGLGLNATSGADLHALINQTLATTKGKESLRLFRRGALNAARASLRAPIEIGDILTSGAIKRLLSRSSEVLTVREVDEKLEKELTKRDGFLSRAVLLVEARIAAESNPYINRLIQRFEELWRAHRDRSASS